MLDAREDVSLCVFLELQHAPGEQTSEAPFEELPQFTWRVTEELAEMSVKAEVRMLAAGHIEDGEYVLEVGAVDRRAPRLQALDSPLDLDEEGRDLGRAERLADEAQRPPAVLRHVNVELLEFGLV
ncbi:MAG: hypothetical protein EXR72_02515 [Myxococcales bacterium]|nr:hypothetical protein [Myxococcales bacterium]